MSKVLQLRRGPEERRKDLNLEPGEIAVTTDTYKIYIGDGKTIGGVCARNSIWAYEWDFTIVSGQTEYSPTSDQEPLRDKSGGIYIVFYSGVKMISSDYTIDSENNKIVLTTAPGAEDDGLNLSICYVGE